MSFCAVISVSLRLYRVFRASQTFSYRCFLKITYVYCIFATTYLAVELGAGGGHHQVLEVALGIFFHEFVFVRRVLVPHQVGFFPRGQIGDNELEEPQGVLVVG